MIDFEKFKNSAGGPWGKAFQWVTYALVGTLAPFWMSVIVIWLSPQEYGVSKLIAHGELSIYAISFIATTVYVLNDKLRARKNLMLMVGITGVTAVLSYVLVVLRDMYPSIVRIDPDKLLFLTLTIFIMNVVFSFYAKGVEIIAEPYTPSHVKDDNLETVSNLNKEYDKV